MNVDMAKRLADRRRAAGLSQEGLAEQLGVSRQAVSKWERSESSPDTDNLIALAQLYGVSLDDLLFGEVEESGEAETMPTGTAPSDTESTVTEEVVVEAVPLDEDDAGVEEAEFIETEVETEEAHSRRSHKGKPENFHIGFDGIEIDDGKDHVHVSWREGVHVIDGKGGDEVHVGWDGVHINDKDYSSLYEAQRDFHHGAYAWHDKDGMPVSDERRKMWRTLNTFPFPLFVIIAYILLGCFQGTWLIGLELFLLIPLYYVTIALFMGHRVRAFFSTLYPVAVLGWFFYMAFVLNEPHPAWVAFLTIPLAEWLFGALAHWWHKTRKKN